MEFLFEGGKAENHELTIGSHTFIPGFEEQLVGINLGEEKRHKCKIPRRLLLKRISRKRCSIPY